MRTRKRKRDLEHTRGNANRMTHQNRFRNSTLNLQSSMNIKKSHTTGNPKCSLRVRSRLLFLWAWEWLSLELATSKKASVCRYLIHLLISQPHTYTWLGCLLPALHSVPQLYPRAGRWLKGAEAIAPLALQKYPALPSPHQSSWHVRSGICSARINYCKAWPASRLLWLHGAVG